MLENILQWLGLGLCHQLPERSFFGGGVQLPVCARDTGIYVGFAVALILLAYIERPRRPTEIPRPAVLLLLVAGIAAMAVDGLTSYLGVRETSNALRLATGLASGFGIAGLTAPLLNSQLWAGSSARRAMGRWPVVAVFVAAGPFTFAILWWVAPAIGVLYPLLVAVAILVTFIAVNLVMVCLLPPLERRARRLRDAWPAILIAFGLTLVELALSAGLRVAMIQLAQAV